MHLDKERLVFGLFLLLLIIAVELVLHRFHLAGWPVFMAMIFFFEAHMDTRRIRPILLGGVTGILCYVATVEFVQYSAGMLGVFNAKLMFICAVVYAIVALGPLLPSVLNNYAFMFFLISGLAASSNTAEANPWLWGLLLLLGGGAVMGAITLIPKAMQWVMKPAP